MKVWGHDTQTENHYLREFQFPVHLGILKRQGLTPVKE